MRRHSATFVIRVALAAMLSAGAAPALAQNYPSKPVRVIVPTAPGGGVDILARVLGQKLSEQLGVQFVVDNRPGAAGNIGNGLAAKAAPDGYTVLMAPSAIAMGATLYSHITYDVVKDFAPISQLASTPYFIVLHPSVPANDVRQLIALAKAHPGQLTYASAGAGSASHLAGELLKRMAGVDIVHVPYKGIGPAMTDVLAGHVSFIIAGLAPAKPQVEAGKLKIIAVADAKRSSLMPKVATVAESGLPGYAVENWIGMFAPAGTPAAIVRKLNNETLKALNGAGTRQQLAAQGLEPIGSSPEEFARTIKTEVEKWARFIKETGIRSD